MSSATVVTKKNTKVVNEPVVSTTEVVNESVTSPVSLGKNLLKIKQVAEMIGISTQSVSKLMKDGRISYYKFGNKTYRFSENQVNNFIVASTHTV